MCHIQHETSKDQHEASKGMFYFSLVCVMWHSKEHQSLDGVEMET
jgi:hypothetical protein